MLPMMCVQLACRNIEVKSVIQSGAGVPAAIEQCAVYSQRGVAVNQSEAFPPS